MTLKDLNKHFKVFKHDDKYFIHSLTEGGRSVFKYLCSAEKTGTKFNVVGYKKTGSIEEFKNQVEDYVSKLEYNSEYFYPLYREGIKEVYFVHDYMSKLGFKSQSDIYVYNPSDIYGGKTTKIIITFSGLDVWERSYNNEEIKVILWREKYSWVEVKVARNFKAIQGGIDSLLKPLLLSEATSNVCVADKLEAVIKEINSSNLDGFEIKSASYKKELKRKLLEIAEKL